MPGRTTIITPVKPAAIASQRRQPTISPRNSAAPMVTASGRACMIAWTFASGMCDSAAMKVRVAPTSPMPRHSTLMCSSCFQFWKKPLCQVSNPISSVAAQPRTKSNWPTFIGPITYFEMASLIVKPAIATIMKIALRVLGERGKAGSENAETRKE
jgi:hypothetical protein